MNTATIPGLDELRRRLEATNDPSTPYEPAIDTVHLPIDCTLYRVPGIKTGRTHHLLGGIEYTRFLQEDLGPCPNIREQFAVPLELSVFVADKLKIKHPYNRWDKKLEVMTVDLVLSMQNGGWTAVDAKPFAKVKQKRVSDKLKLMTEIMGYAGVPHEICTDKDISPIMADNYEILHPFALPFDPPPFSSDDMQRANAVMRRSLLTGERAIRDAARLCEHETGLGRGLSIEAALWFVANGQWQVNLSYKVGPDEPLIFLS